MGCAESHLRVRCRGRRVGSIGLNAGSYVGKGGMLRG